MLCSQSAVHNIQFCTSQNKFKEISYLHRAESFFTRLEFLNQSTNLLHFTEKQPSPRLKQPKHEAKDKANLLIYGSFNGAVGCSASLASERSGNGVIFGTIAAYACKNGGDT
jgi:hypothetical protein